MQWPDEAAQQSGQQLEKVIGYSDGGSFASRIGPQAVNSSSAGGGRFADLVQSRVIAAKDSDGQQQDDRLRAADAEGKGIVRTSLQALPLFLPNSWLSRYNLCCNTHLLPVDDMRPCHLL